MVCTQLVIRHPADVAVSLSHSAWRWQPATPTPPPNLKRARPTPEGASHPDPKPFRDGLIAATALVHSLVVDTRNLAAFEATGVRTLLTVLLLCL